MSVAEAFALVAAILAAGVGLRGLKLTWPLGSCLAGGAGLVYLALRLTVLDMPQASCTAIFALAYALIASDRVHKTKVALGGAVAMLLVRLVGQKEAFHGAGAVEGIDWNTILLLIGMMVIVNITRHTGVFQWLAIKSAKLAKGYPVPIIALLSVVTAVISAGLDNVTTVLLIAPVAILICEGLKTDPVPFLVCVIMASNIGGTATLIGHPPNIMIGSSAGFDFLAFLRVDAPVACVALGLLLLGVWIVLGRRVRVTVEQRAEVMEFDETKAITDRRLLRKCLVVIVLTLIGFVVHGRLGLEPATIALGGAALILFLHEEGPDHALREVEWPTIFFFIGLFIMVSAMVKVGLVNLLGQGLLDLTRGNTFAMTMLILWCSALAAGIVDNIPFVATMTALLHSIAATLHPEASSPLAAVHAPDVLPLWWALSLGACLGANFTIIGAATNVVVGGIAARAGHPIGFGRFLKYGAPVTVSGLTISSLWLWLIFLR